MPLRIKLFWYLALANYLVGVAWSLFHFHNVSETHGTGTSLLGQVFGLIILGSAWLVAYHRVGWLRWFLAGVFLIGVFDIAPMRSHFHSPTYFYITSPKPDRVSQRFTVCFLETPLTGLPVALHQLEAKPSRLDFAG